MHTIEKLVFISFFRYIPFRVSSFFILFDFSHSSRVLLIIFAFAFSSFSPERVSLPPFFFFITLSRTVCHRFFFGRKAFFFVFHTTLFCCPYAHLLFCTSPHSLSFRLRFAFATGNSIFSFSFGTTANPSLLHCVFASRFSYQSRLLSLPLPFLFFFSFFISPFALRTKLFSASAYLPRVSI